MLSRVFWGWMLIIGAVSINSYIPVYSETQNDLSSNQTPIAEDEYDFGIFLNVPQVINNSDSHGYRQYRVQSIIGKLYIYWMEDGEYIIDFDNLRNTMFKVGGKHVTYNGLIDRNVVIPRFNYIGNNKNGVFTVPSMSFYLELEPSYAIGGNTEDNSFYLLLAGKGGSSLTGMGGVRIAKYIAGHVAGTQGCGCSAYGHKSPTRRASISGISEVVEDVVPTYGTWSARWRKRTYMKSTTTILR